MHALPDRFQATSPRPCIEPAVAEARARAARALTPGRWAALHRRTHLAQISQARMGDSRATRLRWGRKA